MARRNGRLGLSTFVLACAAAFLWPTFARADRANGTGKEGVKQPDSYRADVIRLSNGNRITGRVGNIENGMAEIQIDGVGEMDIPVSDIVSVTKAPYVPSPKQPSLAQQRREDERLAQRRTEMRQDYRDYLERRYRQQVFDAEQRRQLQMEADWREFLSHPNINQRFQEDMLFRRYGAWGPMAPWAWRR